MNTEMNNAIQGAGEVLGAGSSDSSDRKVVYYHDFGSHTEPGHFKAGREDLIENTAEILEMWIEDDVCSSIDGYGVMFSVLWAVAIAEGELILLEKAPEIESTPSADRVIGDGFWRPSYTNMEDTDISDAALLALHKKIKAIFGGVYPQSDVFDLVAQIEDLITRKGLDAQKDL